jgi:hypothetical protein
VKRWTRRGRGKVIREGKERRAEGTRRREGRRGEKNVPSVIGRALPPPSLLVDREIDR